MLETTLSKDELLYALKELNDWLVIAEGIDLSPFHLQYDNDEKLVSIMHTLYKEKLFNNFNWTVGEYRKDEG